MFSLIDHKNNKLVFHIKHIDLSIVNSIRRIGLSSIPNVTLDFDMEHPDYDAVKVNKNTSSLHNEMLLHRVSLVPFCFDAEEIENFDTDAYICKLIATGPKHVTTNDIHVFDKDGKKYSDEFHRRIFPRNKITSEHVLILKLKEEQDIDIEFRLTKATAEKHAAWCPVSQFTYSYVHDHNQKSGSSVIDKQRTFVKNKNGDPELLEFKIQSECALTPHYIFAKAIDILKDRVANVPQKVTYKDPVNGLYTLSIDEDVTVLNVLQSFMLATTEFVGYYQPHPLVKNMVLKIKLQMEQNIADFLVQQCNKIVSELSAIQAEWQNFSENKL